VAGVTLMRDGVVIDGIDEVRGRIARLMDIPVDDVPANLLAALRTLETMCFLHRKVRVYIDGHLWDECWHVPEDQSTWIGEGRHVVVVQGDSVLYDCVVTDGKLTRY
jgi:hypothetical protein